MTYGLLELLDQNAAGIFYLILANGLRIVAFFFLLLDIVVDEFGIFQNCLLCGFVNLLSRWSVSELPSKMVVHGVAQLLVR